MMFAKFFSKNCRHYLDKGDAYLCEERYADARHAFQEALRKAAGEKLGSAIEIELAGKIALAGNKLAELNLIEAERAINCGDAAKATDHLQLVLDLSEDAVLRGKAQKLLQAKLPVEQPQHTASKGHNCTSCATTAEKLPADEHVWDEQLSSEDRFNLLIQPLPGDLPERYFALGEKFAHSYLLIHDGNDAAALPTLEAMLAEGENDILLYETALIKYRAAKFKECEEYLRRAIICNGLNPLSYLALVHLLVEAGRFPETINILEWMLNNGIVIEQARVLLGDVHALSGNEEAALDHWSQALQFKGFARGVAEKIIPLLEKQGRNEEAAFLAKTYLKGCC
jgi:predicted negative regulator of RcsB-dependent stress response